MSTTTNTRPIDTITFSTARVNNLDVTITDIVLAYLNTAAAHALRADGTRGVVSVAGLTTGALLKAESDVKRFVTDNRLYGYHTIFANLTGAEIGRMLWDARNGLDSPTIGANVSRHEFLSGSAYLMGEAVLCENADGTVDWF